MVPLFLGLHGGTGSANQFAKGNGFVEAANQFNYVAVFPDGLPCNSILSGLHCWNSGTIECNSYKTKVDEIAFLGQLIGKLVNATDAERVTYFGTSNFKIDPKRVYVTGHSNGAMQSYALAGARPELLAGVAPVSGTIGGQVSKDSAVFQIGKPHIPVTILHVHGKNDINVLVNGGETVGGVDRARIDMSMKQALDFFTAANVCTNQTTVEQFTSTTMNFTRQAASCDKPVMSLLLQADHAWANMNGVVRALDTAPYSNMAYNSLASVISSVLLNYKR